MFIDDHSRFCLNARIVEHDTVEVHIDMHRKIVGRYGIYKALYYDRGYQF